MKKTLTTLFALALAFAFGAANAAKHEMPKGNAAPAKAEAKKEEKKDVKKKEVKKKKEAKKEAKKEEKKGATPATPAAPAAPAKK